ncbi:MAG: hypothetical protein AVDCRST_MAG37-2558 [uncultured Rubrobacteraceae bacterium]|uniref:Uncharacterized protein n=1 Tax=uncultured Rubrobacteraceae bacterium TaxID=349277 RepID=A0A6J4R1J1_9ACTN|nr:MAG: hypothetical protein AVDCRST_MAG37-2558 [uncultured Rubrobacteraceae bacterium]
MISTKALSGAKMLRWSAVLLLIGGLLLGLLSGSLGLAALAFGFGAVHLGLGQLWVSEDRGGRLIGFTLVLVGAFTVIDAAIWMLPGAVS